MKSFRIGEERPGDNDDLLGESRGACGEPDRRELGTTGRGRVEVESKSIEIQ